MLSLSDEHVSFRFEDGLKRLSQMDDYENMFELLDAEDVAYQFREQDLLQQNNVPLTKSRTRKNVSNVQYVKMIKVAISATGEYTAAFGSSYLAWREILEVVTSVSRIFNLELGVRLQLVSGPTTVYSDSINDPFDNYDIGQCVVANQNVLDTVYGKNAYDLGHIFTTDTAGGAAQTGGILYAKLKAMGASGIPKPFGEPFSVDYVAHEMGHQLGADHIFNGIRCPKDTRNKHYSYEPGSGSTIMSYAGLCKQDDIQLHPDPYFNNNSYIQIQNTLIKADFLDSLPTSNHYPQALVDNHVYTIPVQTPFRLVGSGFDQDNDPLTYCWEQIDLDTTRALTIDDQTKDSPLFRSYAHGRDTFRYFPNFDYLLDKNNSIGELLPKYERTMNFTLTVRDQRGGVDFADVSINVTNQSDRFHIIYPNKFESISAGDTATVRWNLGKTSRNPIDCQAVNILLSIDGGYSFQHELALNVLNDGEAVVDIPNVSTSKARIMVEAADNIFFNISENDFEIK